MAAGRAEVSERFQVKCQDPLLDLILQKYIQASRDTIRGPVAIKADLNLFSKSTTDNKRFNKPEIPDEFKLRPTNFDEYSISCFSVGGEKRLAFTELVRTVLKEINVHDIFKKRDILLIFTSKCTQKQLDELKYVGVLPWTSTSSNLITKSDAYRLCGALQGHLASKSETIKHSPASFQVYHECFGGCIGTFDPEFFVDPNSPCIQCAECKGIFSTTKFVSHNHTSYDEVHTCHWGFDSSRWRIYLMLVEQKACPELLSLWNSMKKKFNGSHNIVKGDNEQSSSQDAEFVAYINSPDHKKTVISPIETLRNLEEATVKPERRESTSAFHPWSPKPSRANSSSSRIYENQSKSTDLFRYPANSDAHLYNAALANKSKMNQQRATCGCIPSSPLYSECQQCRNAAHSTCSSSLHLLAQKASERPCEENMSRHNVNKNNCSCDQCKQAKPPGSSLENSVEDIINNFTSIDMKLTTSAKDLAKLLSSAIKQLHISQEDKVREIAISNQRLQTELHLFKLESQKKLCEARDTKAHVEQELETLHRERQKELSLFHQMRWELANQQKEGASQQQISKLQKEINHLKTHLEQSTIDRTNLQKQLNWSHVIHKKATPAEKWSPFPTMARKFSDSEDSEELMQSSSSTTVYPSQQVSVLLKTESDLMYENNPLSPATKTMKLDKESETKGDDSTSDIEVED